MGIKMRVLPVSMRFPAILIWAFTAARTWRCEALQLLHNQQNHSRRPATTNLNSNRNPATAATASRRETLGWIVAAGSGVVSGIVGIDGSVSPAWGAAAAVQ